ncbi:MAG: aminotransferase class V-fold PLP-dependent enzyme [Lachnospiraceae bacterium]
MKKLMYLDNASTTYPKPESVYQAMEEAGRNFAVNAGRGSYSLARKASQLIDDTREKMCNFVHGESIAEVIFTPSATIACNQVLGGLEWKKEDIVYVTPFEHNAIMRVLYHLQKEYKFEIAELAILSENLELDKAKIQFQFLRKPPSVLVINQVSNVSGYIIPWQEITQMAEQYHPIVILDGSQALGLVPIALKNTMVDFYIFAGHKTLYGPLGIGGFINNHGRKLKKILFGGTGSDSLNLTMSSEDVKGYEPGSMNITAIVGLLAALVETMKLPIEENLQMEQKMRNFLIEKLKEIPEVVLYPPLKQEATGILSFNVEGYQAYEVGKILDEEYQIAVRTGYHCAPLIHKYLQNKTYGGTVRVSIGRFNTIEELYSLVKAIQELAVG